jgi:two-component system, NtrC family, sensor kinase
VSVPPEREALAELLPGIASDVTTPAQYVADNVTFLRRAFDKLLPLVHAQLVLADCVQRGESTDDALRIADAARLSARLDHLERQVPRALEQAMHGLGQITDSVRALRELLREPDRAPEPLDLHELLEAIAAATKNEWSYVAELKLELDWSLPPVVALRGELVRLLQAAVVGAARSLSASLPRAAADKGTLTVTTRIVEGRAELTLRGGNEWLSLSLPLAPTS